MEWLALMSEYQFSREPLRTSNATLPLIDTLWEIFFKAKNRESRWSHQLRLCDRIKQLKFSGFLLGKESFVQM